MKNQQTPRTKQTPLPPEPAAGGSLSSVLEEGIRERRELHEQLSRANEALAGCRLQMHKARADALHDPVTGLPNFTLFKDRLEFALSQARRHEWRLALMFIDLERFRQLNDLHGHRVGDACLKEVGRRLEGVTRGEDTVARRSADLFQFLMLEAKDLSVIGALATKLEETIGAQCELGTLKLSVRPRIGISVFPEDGHSAQELIEKAEAAMYGAKRRAAGPMFWSELPPSC